MAAPTITLTVAKWPNGVDQTQLRSIVEGTGSIGSGGLYATGGLALPWTDMQDGNFNNAQPFVGNWGPAQTKPVWASAYSASSGFVYAIDPSNGNLRIFQGNAASGTLSAPALTMNSYTPAGTNNSATPPIFTGTPAVLTGSVAAPTFTGAGAAALVELTNGASVTADTINFRAEFLKNAF